MNFCVKSACAVLLAEGVTLEFRKAWHDLSKMAGLRMHASYFSMLARDLQRCAESRLAEPRPAITSFPRGRRSGHRSGETVTGKPLFSETLEAASSCGSSRRTASANGLVCLDVSQGASEARLFGGLLYVQALTWSESF